MNRRLAYSLGNLVRRIREYMHKRETARAIMWIFMGLVLTIGIGSIPEIFAIRWGLPVWRDIILRILCILGVLAVMTIPLYILLNKILKMDDKDDSDMEKRMEVQSERFDKAMQKHTEAIVAALQKNSETIIRAMHEPLDGHE